MPSIVLNRSAPTAFKFFPLKKRCINDLRIMTYNVRIDHEEDRGGSHVWQQRAPAVAALIHAYTPDLLLLQEPLLRQIDDLKEALPQYLFEFVAAGTGEEWEERLVFAFLPEMLGLEQSKAYSLSQTPHHLGAIGWDAHYPRACAYGRFHLSSGEAFHVFNTHFDHKGCEARLQSAHLVRRLMADLPAGECRVLGGDFNCRLSEGGISAYAALVSDKLVMQDVRDLAQEEHYGPDGTWIGWEYDGDCATSGQVGDRIDHLFFGGPLIVRREGVLLDPQHLNACRLLPSDHLPVISDVYTGGA